MMCADRKGKVGWKARERKRILASHMKRYVRERYECTAGVADASLGQRDVVAAGAHARQITIGVPCACAGPCWCVPCVVHGRSVGFLERVRSY